MSALLGWTPAFAAVVAGWLGWGWRGLALAVTAIVFWLLLQFSRTLRVMRQAAGRPVGRVASAVMLHARLSAGQRLLQVLPLAGSLGERVADDPETFRWRDDGGAAVVCEFRAGRLAAWRLERPPEAPAP